MKRLISILLILSLLYGCTQNVISPVAKESQPISMPQVSDAPTIEPVTPSPSKTPVPALPTYASTEASVFLFPEELLSQDGEPIASEINALLAAPDLTKDAFYDHFTGVIQLADELDASLPGLVEKGRMLTEDRREGTIKTLESLMSNETMDALQYAYMNCAGEGPELPVKDYAAGLTALADDLRRMEPRTETYFTLDAAADYRTVLERYMGEPVSPQDVFDALESLMQTEAYAIAGALMVDPEAARKKEPISLGNYKKNMAFLCNITREICPSIGEIELFIPPETTSTATMDLLELAFRLYPGMAFLKTYAASESDEQKARWANASDGYLAGLAVHCSHTVVPYLESFGLDYVQYRWYEDMLYVTMTGMAALLIHYYGYTQKDLADYLKSWGAADFTDELYEKAMNDPFESLVASYGYYRYIDICEACMEAGCESETLFLRDYLAAGPAPYAALKEYMVCLYQNEG